MPDLRSALAALDEAGVVHCVRNDGQRLDELGPGEDLDVLLSRRDLAAASTALEAAGHHRLAAPGHRGHRFHVGVDARGDWRKVDLVSRLRYGGRWLPVEPLLARRRREDGVWLVSEADEQAHHDRRSAGLGERSTATRSLARRRPAGLRRRGPVVAVLGPDGAGKGSILDGVTARLPVGVTRVYLGNRRTSGGAGRSTRRSTRLSTWREAVFLLRKALPLYAALVTAYAAAWRGHVVLCDRHPSEVLAVRPERTPVGARLERLLLARLVPAPDRVVVLDAPGELLHARKGEHDAQTLERWRQGYLRAFVPPGTVIPTSGPLEDSVQSLLDVLWRELSARNRWSSQAAVPR